MKQSAMLMKLILFPLSLLYGLITGCRNWMFNIGILKTKKYNLPLISIGNLAVGGTGKTPHTEYLISLLSPKMGVAVLSRGYKRKTKGFLLADEQSTSKEIGDEPYQMKQKFGDVIVAVDANRQRGIDNLLKLDVEKDIEVILLDDAYQHRYVEPGINILLTDYNRLFTEDSMLPLGRLRESAHNKKRADIIIVTKCPEDTKAIDFRLIGKKLEPRPYQNLYFTSYQYDELKPVFPESENYTITKDDIKSANYTAIILTGIVSTKGLTNHVATFTENIIQKKYPDHHNYSAQDLEELAAAFDAIEGKQKIIITTEKDAARLINKKDVPFVLRKYMYSLPIKVKFLANQENEFNNQIFSYVRKNKTNHDLLAK